MHDKSAAHYEFLFNFAIQKEIESMRNIIHFLPLLLIYLFLLGSTSSCHHEKEQPSTSSEKAETPMDTTATIVLKVNRCARLYTTEYHIHKIVTHTDEPTLKGHILGIPVNMNTRIGDRKIAIPIDVTLKGYIDFSDFNTRNVNRTDSSIVITLPEPKIIATATQVDHKGTRQFIDLTRSRYTDEEITQFTRQGTEQILKNISRYGILEQTRMSAARTLIPILQHLGYKEEQIEVRFGKIYNDDELFKMVQLQ